MFFVLALIDMIIAFVKKDSPFALRVVTAVVAVACMVLMGTAYTDVFGNPVWTNAPATVLSFVAGDLAWVLVCALRLASRICPKSPLHTRWLLLMWCLPLVWRLSCGLFGCWHKPGYAGGRLGGCACRFCCVDAAGFQIRK